MTWRLTESPRLLRWVRVYALLLGAIRAWSSRHASNPSGISYLDVSDAYMNGDFANAVNGTFSPLYSLLLGPVLRIVDPGPAHEAAVVHAVNFAIYCMALWAFDRLLAALRHRAEGTPNAVPDWAWIVFGYAVFTWSSLELIGVADMSADLLMAVFVYGAAAVLVRMDGPTNSPANGVRLGIMLGLGYLAKTAMFPLAFVFFVCGLLSGRGWRLNVPALVTALLVFAVVVSPFVTALSRQKGRLATGDIGWLDYAWFVNGVTMYAHWQGGPAGYGTRFIRRGRFTLVQTCSSTRRRLPARTRSSSTPRTGTKASRRASTCASRSGPCWWQGRPIGISFESRPRNGWPSACYWSGVHDARH
jgi:hypothetical protein